MSRSVTLEGSEEGAGRCFAKDPTSVPSTHARHLRIACNSSYRVCHHLLASVGAVLMYKHVHTIKNKILKTKRHQKKTNEDGNYHFEEFQWIYKLAAQAGMWLCQKCLPLVWKPGWDSPYY